MVSEMLRCSSSIRYGSSPDCFPSVSIFFAAFTADSAFPFDWL